MSLTHTHEAIMLAHPATVTSTTPATRPPHALQRTLWVVQLLLAAVFLLVGYTHAAAPIEVAVQRAPWVASLPVALVRFIGVVELAGAVGILLPAAMRIMPVLTPLAAVGLATMMALAIPFHLLRGETSAVLLNLGLGSFAALVALGRTRWAPISANR